MRSTRRNTEREFKRAERVTFEDVSLNERGVELKRPIAILDHVLVQLQLAVAEGSVAAKTTLKSDQSCRKNKIRLRKIGDRNSTS